MAIVNVTSSHRMTFTTGQVTVIAAATATAGCIMAFRNPTASARSIRIRSFEPEFFLSTAFGAAQEIGFSASIARAYTTAHTDGTAVTMTGGRMKTGQDATAATASTASTAELTTGVHTFDANPIAKGSLWCSAIGANLAPRLYDFTGNPLGGIILGVSEGIVVRNSILMGATGVGRWYFTLEWDDCIVS